MQSFTRPVNRNAAALDPWLAAAVRAELRRFAENLRPDIDPVRAARDLGAMNRSRAESIDQRRQNDTARSIRGPASAKYTERVEEHQVRPDPASRPAD
jgi:hypothetical protein